MEKNKQLAMASMGITMKYADVGIPDSLAEAISALLLNLLNDEIEKGGKIVEEVVPFIVFDDLVAKDKTFVQVDLDSFSEGIRKEVAEIVRMVQDGEIGGALNYLKNYALRIVGREEMERISDEITKEVISEFTYYLEDNLSKTNGRKISDVIEEYKKTPQYQNMKL